MRRNKRCLLAYHRVRLNKIKKEIWNGSDGIGEFMMRQESIISEEDESIKVGTRNFNRTLSAQEEQYVQQYRDLLAQYKSQWNDVDLTGSLEPPRDLFIDVRVLKDTGEIQTEYG